MPKFELPELSKESDETYPEAMGVEGDRWMRLVRLPVNKDIINALEVGEEVVITLRGKLTESSMRELSEGKNDSNIELEVFEVEAYSESDYEKLDREMDERDEDYD